MIRLVATDLDGTFWTPRLVVPERHVKAVREFASRGVTVLVATSRRPRVVRQALANAGLSLPAVVLDGAIGIDFRTGQRFHEAVFETVVAAATLDAFRSANLDPCVYIEAPDVDIVLSDSPSTCRAHLRDIRSVSGVVDLDAVVRTRAVYGFSLLGVARDRLEPIWRLLVQLGVPVQFHAVPGYGEDGLLVNPPGVSKWTAIEAYCRLAGIEQEEVLAVGDGDNDVAMLARAAVAVAVKGGTAGVLDLADHVIDPPHQDGWESLLDLVD